MNKDFGVRWVALSLAACVATGCIGDDVSGDGHDQDPTRDNDATTLGEAAPGTADGTQGRTGGADNSSPPEQLPPSEGSQPVEAPAADTQPVDVQTLDVGSVPADTVSNMPNATISTVATTAVASGLRVVSINRFSDPAADEQLGEFYALLANLGVTTLCNVFLEAEFRAGDAVTSPAGGYAESVNHVDDSGLQGHCIPSGGFAVVRHFGFTPIPFAPARITRVDLKLDANTEDWRVDPLAPSVTSAAVAFPYGPDTVALSGAATAGGGAIHDLIATVYPIDRDWLVYDWLLDHHPQTLASPGSWQFETDPTERGRFMRYLLSFEYVPGGTQDATTL